MNVGNTPFLAYRDILGVRSEIEFLRRQYIGFTRLRPIWIGRSVLPQATELGASVLRLGGSGLVGGMRRTMFRHLGYVPDIPATAPVLHAQFARGGVLALPLTQAHGLRMFVTLHGGDVTKQKNWHNTLLARKWTTLVQNAAGFICVSQAVADVAAARGVPDEKRIVLPIGVEIPATPPAREPQNYLFVGRFVEKKGIAVLADAVRTLRAQGNKTPLVCVGDGKLRTVLEDLARETVGITLTGWLPPAAVRAQMSRAIALIVPSIIASDGDAEGLPSVIPEAMAQACSVIGSDQGGISEALRHNETGVLVPPGDSAALAAAMNAIDPSLGLAGYRYAAAHLNAHTQSATLERILLPT